MNSELREEIVQPTTHHIKDQILVHVQDSDADHNTVRGDHQEEMKGFEPIETTNQFGMIAQTPSQNLGDMNSQNRKYKQSNAREIYTSAMREKNSMMNSNEIGNEAMSTLITK